MPLTPPPTTFEDARARWIEAERGRAEAHAEALSAKVDRDRLAKALERIRAGEPGWQAIAAEALDYGKGEDRHA